RPVRYARRVLNVAARAERGEGLITDVPNGGPIVAKISVESIYRVVGALEGLAVRLFTRRASAGQGEGLGRAAEALEQAYQSTDRAPAHSQEERLLQGST